MIALNAHLNAHAKDMCQAGHPLKICDMTSLGAVSGSMGRQQNSISSSMVAVTIR